MKRMNQTTMRRLISIGMLVILVGLFTILAGAGKGVLGALHMEGGDPHRYVHGDEGFHDFPPANTLLNNIPSLAPFVNGFSLDMSVKVA